MSNSATRIPEKYIVGFFADHEELDGAQAVIEGKANEGKDERTSFQWSQSTLDAQDAFTHLFLDNAPLGRKHKDIRIYLIVAEQQGPAPMEAIVRTAVPYFYRQHSTLPLVAFSSGFCGGYRKEGEKADILGDVCLAKGAMKHRPGDKITEAGLEACVETAEPEGWHDWNNLAGTPNEWNKPDQIRGVKLPERKNEDGVETDCWQPQLRRGYSSTDEVVKNFEGAFDEVEGYHRKIVALDMDAYNLYRAMLLSEPGFIASWQKRGIRQITDYAEGKNEDSDKRFQPYGARLAVLYLLELMGLYVIDVEDEDDVDIRQPDIQCSSS